MRVTVRPVCTRCVKVNTIIPGPGPLPAVGSCLAACQAPASAGELGGDPPGLLDPGSSVVREGRWAAAARGGGAPRRSRWSGIFAVHLSEVKLVPSRSLAAGSSPWCPNGGNGGSGPGASMGPGSELPAFKLASIATCRGAPGRPISLSMSGSAP
jgi:hypothetical protein